VPHSHFNAIAGVIPWQYRHKRYIAKKLHSILWPTFCHEKYRCILNHFYVIRPESFGEITLRLGLLRRSSSPKTHMRRPISD